MTRRSLLSEFCEAVRLFVEVAEQTRRTRLLAKVERRLEKAIGRGFDEQRDLFLKKLALPVEEAAGEPPVFPQWESIWDEVGRTTLPVMAAAVDEAVQYSFTVGAEQTIGTLGGDIAFDLAVPEATAYLENHGAELVTKINETTRDRLRTTITNGLEQGKSYGQIARDITDTFDGFTGKWPQAHLRNRAHAVAVYETGDAYEAAGEAVSQHLAGEGLEMQKGWLTAGDSKVRPAHRANAAQGWIPADQEFQSGHMRPPTDPGCRCATKRRVRPEVEQGELAA